VFLLQHGMVKSDLTTHKFPREKIETRGGLKREKGKEPLASWFGDSIIFSIARNNRRPQNRFWPCLF